MEPWPADACRSDQRLDHADRWDTNSILSHRLVRKLPSLVAIFIKLFVSHRLPVFFFLSGVCAASVSQIGLL